MLKFPTCKFRLGCADQVLCWGPISLVPFEVSYTDPLLGSIPSLTTHSVAKERQQAVSAEVVGVTLEAQRRLHKI